MYANPYIYAFTTCFWAFCSPKCSPNAFLYFRVGGIISWAHANGRSAGPKAVVFGHKKAPKGRFYWGLW
nr:hypothetical protein [Capnocytophaga canimorsus]